MTPRTRTTDVVGPIAKRLERLREAEGLGLAEFHRRVMAASGVSREYRTVQRYHTGHHDSEGRPDDSAPLDYLIDVCETFRASLDCLALGHGDLYRDTGMDPSRWAIGALASPFTNSPDKLVAVGWWDTLGRLFASLPHPDDGPDQFTDHDRVRVAGALRDTILHPVQRLRGGLDQLSLESQTRYLRAALEAVRAAIAPTGKGLSYNEVVGDFRYVEVRAELVLPLETQADEGGN